MFGGGLFAAGHCRSMERLSSEVLSLLLCPPYDPRPLLFPPKIDHYTLDGWIDRRVFLLHRTDGA